VFLNEHKVVADLHGQEEEGEMQWYLDTGASNHMTGDAFVFSELNPGVIGSVRFGDGSLVEIAGWGTVLFASKDGGHRAFHDVYHIPRLRSNILSIGQLDEHGCKIEIDEGILRMLDRATMVDAIVDAISNEVEADVDVLASLVQHRVLGEC
jgi:hypothetical protein